MKKNSNRRFPKELKEKIVTVRLTELQYEQIYQYSVMHKRTLSDFMRLKSLGDL